MSVNFGSISKTIQCVNVPVGASGSSMINARLRVPAGTSTICNGGLLSAPSREYCSGIRSPSRNATLVIFISLLRRRNHALPLWGIGPTPRTDSLLSSVYAPRHARLSDNDLLQKRQLWFQAFPNPNCQIFARRVFEAGNLVEIIMIEFLVNRFECGGNIGVIHQPPELRIAFAFDDYVHD